MIGASALMVTKKFSEKSFDPVTDNRLPHFCADCNAKSGLSLFVILTDDNKIGGVNSSPFS